MVSSELKKIAKKMPMLQTKRLILRRMRASDDADMYEYASQPSVSEYLLWSPHQSREQSYHYLRSVQECYKRAEFFDWAITLVDSGKMIGTCGYTTLDADHSRAEIGYVLNPRYWGQGIACEAAKAAIGYAFDVLNVNRVEAHYMVGNERSRRVMEKCGMSFEGVLRQYMFVKGSYRDIGVCAVTRDRFQERDCYRKVPMHWIDKLF